MANRDVQLHPWLIHSTPSLLSHGITVYTSIVLGCNGAEDIKANNLGMSAPERAAPRGGGSVNCCTDQKRKVSGLTVSGRSVEQYRMD